MLFVVELGARCKLSLCVYKNSLWCTKETQFHLFLSLIVFFFCMIGVSHSYDIFCRWNYQLQEAVFNQEVGCRWGRGQKTLGRSSFIRPLIYLGVKYTEILLNLSWIIFQLALKKKKNSVVCFTSLLIVAKHQFLNWVGSYLFSSKLLLFLHGD